MKKITWLQRNALAQGLSLYQKYEHFTIPALEETNSCRVIGVTGIAAAGKSTLINPLMKEFRKKDITIAALLIDPSSEDGSALLADRNELRDSELDLDEGLFIHSFATRGAKSALTVALPKMIGFTNHFVDIVIIETAGAGQTDVEIESYVDTLLQVLAPLGGALTLEKAGQNEKAHIFAVNERESFTNTKQFFALAEIELGQKTDVNGWIKKVFLVNALEKKGIAELIEGLRAHKEFLESNKPAKL